MWVYSDGCTAATISASYKYEVSQWGSVSVSSFCGKQYRETLGQIDTYYEIKNIYRKIRVNNAAVAIITKCKQNTKQESSPGVTAPTDSIAAKP
jgi:hypothetical protein